MSTAAEATYQLDDRWRTTAHPVVLTGVQAIGRMLVEQRARDRHRGFRTATFVSGYQGSPLAGLDKVLQSIPALVEEHDIRVLPGVNEELAATAIWGSQQSRPVSDQRYDGVVGIWYGKAPGLDRAGDAIRHANTMGAHPAGGVVALVGDDPACKSSTLPSASERTLAALGLPVLFPRDASDLIRLGCYAVELSRRSGCWVGMKIVADVADGLWTLTATPEPVAFEVPSFEWAGRPWTYQQQTMPAPPISLGAEAELAGPRWAMVESFAAANPVDELLTDPADAWLTIVCVGTATRTVEQTLEGLSLSLPELDRRGVRVLSVCQPYPLSSAALKRACRGVDDVLVVEEKASFVESQIRDLLYGSPHTPRVYGKHDADGVPLIPSFGEVGPAVLHPALRRVLSARIELPPRVGERTQLSVIAQPRSAYFCSGCPHNRSTVVPEGSIAAGGIGCHAMVAAMPRSSSRVIGMTQMGGEGAQWIGQSLLSPGAHLFQNMGDGTFFHSGQLAIQACIAAGVNVTFKILHNSAVAMTGGQDAQGAIPVPALTRKLAAEGVRRIIVCTDAPRKYGRRAGFATDVDVWSRDRLDDAQRILRDTPGVTALIYDQRCAAETRRLRKRGKLPPPEQRVVINEAVCEGCGDCGRKSNCLSVEPVHTDFGRKTRIDQSSCNADYSCLDGDCPAFVTVETRDEKTRHTAVPVPPSVPQPPPAAISDHYGIVLAGIGGTGIVTVNQVLATAATLAGLHSHGLDQTGLSQKAGPVTSHLVLSADDTPRHNKVAPETADCYLALDPLVGADPRNLAALATARTTAVISTSHQPTGDMVFDSTSSGFDADELAHRIASAARHSIALDTVGAARALFGSTVAANMLAVGAAYQTGAVPIAADHIEQAIALNGVAVELNVAAFRWGRAAVAAPTTFDEATASGIEPSRTPTTPFELVASPLEGAVRQLTAYRAGDLRRYQNDRLARRYVRLVEATWRAERAVTERTELSAAVARGLHRVFAYKDEYEVAHLLCDPAFRRYVRQEIPGGGSIKFRLHPPLLRALGRERKIALSTRWLPVLWLLARLRFLRGSPFDPFGHTRVRRAERALAADYISMVDRQLDALTEDSYPTAVTVATLVDAVRGYEELKMERMRSFYELVQQLEQQPPSAGA